MTFRQLSIEDVDQISNLYHKHFSDGWSKQMLVSAFNGGRFLCLGAFENQNLIGVVTSSTTAYDADLESIIVSPEFRQQGIGKKLLSMLIEKLEMLNILKIFLEVRESNLSARVFYEKNGFSKISKRKKYYPDGEDALIYLRGE